MSRSRTITPQMALPLRRLGAAISGRSFDSFVVHPAPSITTTSPMSAVVPGVRAMAIEEFLGSDG